jgi:hypothetical protein
LERSVDGGRDWHDPPDHASDLESLGLQPHRSDTFKLAADPQSIEKVRDIVGLNLDPPAQWTCKIDGEVIMRYGEPACPPWRDGMGADSAVSCQQ